MSKAFEKVRAFIPHHSMLAGARGVIVAVSGGPDSVALLDMLARLCMKDEGRGMRDETEDDERGIEDAHPFHPPSFIPHLSSLHVAHLNHQLRGSESDEDAAFVERLAERYGLAVTIGAADVRAEAAKSGRGIEEVARELRYNFLLATARSVGYDRIATGHTMNDQAETFLMRLARGAGLRGLAAMRPVTKAHEFAAQVSGGMGQGAGTAPSSSEAGALEEMANANSPRHLLVRPLLCLTREEIEEYCRERGLEFRVDPSNTNLDYTRNHVRHEVLPALRSINPRAVENIARAAEIIAGEEDALARLVKSYLDQIQVGSATGHRRDVIKSALSAYSVSMLLKEPAGLRRRLIIEAINRAREFQTDVAGAQITSAHVEAVEKLLQERASGSRVQLPGGLEAWREFDSLVFKFTTEPHAQPEQTCYEFKISEPQAQVDAGGLTIKIERGLAGDLLGEIINEARLVRESGGRDWLVVALDDEALPARLVVRMRRPGERARVLGQARTKKLKNLMIDHKIPTSRRATWPIVATPDGRYVWSPSLPPAVEFAARDKSHRLAILRASVA